MERLKPLQAAGVLQTAIPEWSQIEGLYQRDPYHTFSVDVHSMATPSRLLYALERAVLDSPGIWPSMSIEDLTELATNTDEERAFTLRLACLLHDIGKGHIPEPTQRVSSSEGESHSVRGARIAYRIAAEMCSQEALAERCSRLVRHHLLLAETASRRDVHDPTTIEAVMAALGDTSILDDLYLLTLADASATGPQAWNSWRRSLVTHLYMACRSKLGIEDADIPAATVSNTEELASSFASALAEAGIPSSKAALVSNAAPPSLLTSRAPSRELVAQTVARYLRSEGMPSLEARDIGDGYYELAVVAHDAPGLFAKIAGSIALASMSVVSAQAHTLDLDPPIAVDLFFVHAPSGRVGSEEGRAELEDRIRSVISGRIALSDRLSLKTSEWRRQLDARARRAGETTPGEEPVVHIDNDSSKDRTIIEFRAQNRPRLLYDVASTLAELGLNIRAAKISTVADTAADVFYVTDSSGTKLEDPEHIREVRQALAFALSSDL